MGFLSVNHTDLSVNHTDKFSHRTPRVSVDLAGTLEEKRNRQQRTNPRFEQMKKPIQTQAGISPGTANAAPGPRTEPVGGKNSQS
jgi:hypothetical protein